MKDLPEILYRLLKGFDVRKTEKLEYSRFKKARDMNNKKTSHLHYKHLYDMGNICVMRITSQERNESVHNLTIYGMRYINSQERSERRLAMAKKVLDRYNHDPEFRFLYERVSDFFADSLKADMEILKSDKKGRISFAAKWCPSLYSSFDESKLLCESIARKVFPRDLYPEYDGVEEAHYAYRVRDRLRKEVLVPLRKALQLPEVYMSANEWNILPYSRVASVAMKACRELFFKHDEERFANYLKEVKSGKEKIAAGAMLPHEIIADLACDYDGIVSNCDGEVAELQWKRMVDDLLQMGKLRNCMAICDVSGSMQGIPMAVSVALGLLVSELSDDPWKGKLITFSANPKLLMVEGNTLLEKVLVVTNMEWGMNTNFQRVFDLILKVAVGGKLNEDQMIKRLFVFSDMEFDQASYHPWETDYEAIVRKFTAAGYGNAVPEIVWNLRDSKSTPVVGAQKGVALVSGFSKNMIKLFLKDDGSLNPLAVMERAISGEECEKLVVLD